MSSSVRRRLKPSALDDYSEGRGKAGRDGPPFVVSPGLLKESDAMPSLFPHLPVLFAQGDAAPAAGGDTGGFIIQMLPFLLIFVLFYFLFMRPQMQQEKKRMAMLKAMKRNDRVLTSAGIYGTVVTVDDTADKVILKVGEDDRGVKIAFTRASIVKVMTASAEKVADPE